MIQQKTTADVRDMHAVHTMFRREFALMPGLIQGIPAANTGRVAIVADHIALMNDVLHHHHSAEDVVVWPQLLQRAPSECDPLIELMERQHAQIEEMLGSVRELLKVWRGDSATEAGADLTIAIEGLLIPLFDHMAMEEERILPLASRYFTQVEWNKLAEMGAEGLRENAPLVLGMMMYEGDPDVIGGVLATLAGKEAGALKVVAAQAFAQHALKVYGTATPPRIGATNTLLGA